MCGVVTRRGHRPTVRPSWNGHISAFGSRRSSPAMKKAGSHPCRIPAKILPLFRAIYCFSELRSWGKLCDSPGGDLDGRTRLWIASVAGFPLGDREGAETNQGNPIPSLQGTGDALHRGVDCVSGLRFTDITAGCDTIN